MTTALANVLPLDAHFDAELNLRPADIAARLNALNMAAYLQRCTAAELAALVGAIAAECSCRGIQVLGPLGTAAARIEDRAAQDAR